MIANVVKDLGLDSFNWPGAAAFAMLALALTLALLAGVGPPRGRAHRVMLRLAVFLLLAFMTLPTVVVIACPSIPPPSCPSHLPVSLSAGTRTC